MSRCTRLASKRTGCRGGVVDGVVVGVGVDGDALGVGVGRGEGVGETVGPVGETIGGIDGGESGAPLQPRSDADSAAATMAARLIWRPYVAASTCAGVIRSAAGKLGRPSVLPHLGTPSGAVSRTLLAGDRVEGCFTPFSSS